MADRVLGQLSLADGLAASDKTIFDLVSKELDWAPIRTLLDHRSGPGSGNTSIRRNHWCAVFCWACGMG
ncbi:hypothetical protein GCM10010869_34860 [Mesorhizobium tianshanense]|uniref:Uncharacterized protein n=1 Tax=Mesorhizobium tianshanense TaxID=39844 RepID=A0A562NFJ7_9HYPH|nr:hypothetical protein [Mesorhizobium tianshanense]TWI30897.1 hypothetical protein IQ26_04724 [Mesorhizobium tianshanense]GLS37892.1 hypothetical protein GCM10010869_34860 [Mesorhizobium tianshanense]